MVMLAMEDEETQRNGLVFIQYKVGEQQGKSPSRQILWKGCQYASGMPLRIAMIHICLPKQVLPFVWLMKLALEKVFRDRIKVHEGEPQDILEFLFWKVDPKTLYLFFFQQVIEKKLFPSWQRLEFLVTLFHCRLLETSRENSISTSSSSSRRVFCLKLLLDQWCMSPAN